MKILEALVFTCLILLLSTTVLNDNPVIGNHKTVCLVAMHAMMVAS